MQDKLCLAALFLSRQDKPCQDVFLHILPSITCEQWFGQVSTSQWPRNGQSCAPCCRDYSTEIRLWFSLLSPENTTGPCICEGACEEIRVANRFICTVGIQVFLAGEPKCRFSVFLLENVSVECQSPSWR